MINKNKSNKSLGRKILMPIAAITILGLLAGCAPSNLKAPCPDFGKYCTKTPINSWNYKD